MGDIQCMVNWCCVQDPALTKLCIITVKSCYCLAFHAFWSDGGCILWDCNVKESISSDCNRKEKTIKERTEKCCNRDWNCCWNITCCSICRIFDDDSIKHIII